MKISELVVLTENKLATLNQAVATARQRGDTEEIARNETEVQETQDTLDKLRAVAE